MYLSESTLGRHSRIRLQLYYIGFMAVVIMVLQVNAVGAASKISLEKLRCEYLIDPLGIDQLRPRLSWELRSSDRGQSQSAYRVLVASDREKLKKNDGDLWDSGKVLSSKSSQIEYSGKPLKSRMRCYWKVCAWDQQDNACEWSSPAFWSMGLIDSDDWKAKWIAYNTDPLNEDKELLLPPSPYFRSQFKVEGKISRATAYVSALGIFEFTLNGQRVGTDHFTPGWTNYNKRVYYLTYDVTDLLNQGTNAAAGVISNGWYAGYVGFALLTGYPKTRSIYGDTPALRAQLEIEYEDGSRQTIETDDSWKASTGPVRKSDILMGEWYDARKEMPGWDQPGFDDSGWKRVSIINHQQVKIDSYPGVPVRRMQLIKPVEITEPEKGVFVFNMGQNFSGRVRLRVKGKAGTKVTLRFAEMLWPDGNIMTDNLRKARATDVYILRGSTETEVWEPRFTYHGFQYVEVTGYPGRPDIESITGVVLHSDTPVCGGFECSNPLINKLYSNITWTQRSNFFEVPTDCPQRDERLGWTGDAQVYIRSATYNMDVAAFFKKWLVALEDDQLRNGTFGDYAPRPYQHHEAYSPAWMDAGVICPYTIYKVYGDTRVIERHYEAMKKFMEFQLKHSRDFLRPGDGNSWGDWLALGGETPKDLIATAYFAYDAKLMAEMSWAIGKCKDSRYYRDLFEKIKAAFDKAYVSDDVLIKGDTQTCYVLALSMDLLSEAKRKKAQDRLVELLRKSNWQMGTGFLGTKPLLPVLSELGRTDIAYRLIRSTEFPSWGYSIEQGATTMWERWNSYTKEKGFETPGMNSFNHYAFGAVCEWMFSCMAGIDTDGPGYKRILIRPRPDSSMNFVKAHYDSINGRIATDWKIKDGNFLLSVTIPANTTATVYVPAKSPETVTESGKSLEEAESVHFLTMKNDYAVCQIGSGVYEFFSSSVKFPGKNN